MYRVYFSFYFYASSDESWRIVDAHRDFAGLGEAVRFARSNEAREAVDPVLMHIASKRYIKLRRV